MAYWGFLGAGTMFNIFSKYFISIWLEYGVLVIPGYGVLDLVSFVASTSGTNSSHVAKRTSDDDDDDACVEIPLVTPLYSTVVIPSSGNQGGSYATPTAEGSNNRDSRGKGVMVDYDVAPSAGARRPRPSSGPALSLRNVFGNAIHTNFFPFYVSPYYATYPEEGVAGNWEFTREEWDAPYRPTFRVLT
ncbi:hypothetical protein Tco_0221868 [Tanacetum coccineum]